MKIVTRDVPPRAAWALEQAGIHPLLARLYAARGVLAQEEMDNGLGRLLPPATMKNVPEAACLLADAETKGTLGPSLDGLQPTFEQVVAAVSSGPGVMPTYEDKLTTEEIEALAHYVSSVAGEEAE